MNESNIRLLACTTFHVKMSLIFGVEKTEKCEIANKKKRKKSTATQSKCNGYIAKFLNKKSATMELYYFLWSEIHTNCIKRELEN